MKDFTGGANSAERCPVLLNISVPKVIRLTGRLERHAAAARQSYRGEDRHGVEFPAVMGIESEIREALTNLILNAVMAVPTAAC